MGEHDSLLEPLPKLDRDRGSGAVATVHERSCLFADELLKLIDLELEVGIRGREDSPDRAGHRSDSGSALGELSAGGDEARKQLLARGCRLLGDLREGFDGPASHPAASVLAVASELFDPLPEDRGHGAIMPRRRMPP